MTIVRLKLFVLIFAALFAAMTAVFLSQARTAADEQSNVSALSGEHPSAYYMRAISLFQKGKKDDAVFVFYLGQLRFRTHLLAHPQLKPDSDPALFSSLSEVVGGPINEYAFGDIPALARIIDEVIAFDDANPDKFTSPTQFADAHAKVREGLLAMKASMLADAETIREQRRQHGLENRN